MHVWVIHKCINTSIPDGNVVPKRKFSIKRGRRGAELGQQLDICVPAGYGIVDAADVIRPFAVSRGDYVMFNWSGSDGWMKGQVVGKCTGKRDLDQGCTHLLRHTQLRTKANTWAVTLKQHTYVNGSNEPSRWCFLKPLSCKKKWKLRHTLIIINVFITKMHLFFFTFFHIFNVILS